jgi:subtilase family serine protease
MSFINVSGTRSNAAHPHALPAGYGPARLQDAYKIASAAATRGAGQTVAIVDAYDDPKAGADLNKYRSTFGLPACTTANGCFKKLNQNGVAGSYPPADAGWAEEISLDVDMVSAACPNCKIVLVEANSNAFSDLGIAENTAAGLAKVVSNSFGAVEGPGIASLQGPYNHTGVFILASTGDDGYGEDDNAPQFPSVLPKVTAVGGTALRTSTNARGWTEKAWGPSGGQTWGAGSGCSTIFAKPAWQTDTGCAKRMVADVSADADPVTGVTIYDSFGGDPGFEVFGGTSASSPFIAGVVGLAQNGATIAHSRPYSQRSHLFDVTRGNNITTDNCVADGFPSYYCHGVVGYDGPTGLGTPNGYLAF